MKTTRLSEERILSKENREITYQDLVLPSFLMARAGAAVASNQYRQADLL